MSSSAPAHGPEPPSRRRGLRYSVEAPLDITVLRSGVPDTMPGRSVDLGVGGLAAVLAGELLPGESVGVEIRLPQSENSFRARALVRHNNRLRCGMEFIGLSPEQQSAIRQFAEKSRARTARDTRPKVALEVAKNPPPTTFAGGPPAPPPPIKQWSRGWIFLLLSAAILVGVLWSRWNREWDRLESGLQENAVIPQPEAHVPADVMEKLVRHRVDPDYPAAARPGNLQGIIVLEITVNRDGTVADVHPMNGPEILAQSAMDAMRWWRFEPYRVDGKPVVAQTTVAMEFKP